MKRAIVEYPQGQGRAEAFIIRTQEELDEYIEDYRGGVMHPEQRGNMSTRVNEGYTLIVNGAGGYFYVENEDRIITEWEVTCQ